MVILPNPNLPRNRELHQLGNEALIHGTTTTITSQTEYQATLNLCNSSFLEAVIRDTLKISKDK